MLSALKKELEVDVSPPGNGVMRICDADGETLYAQSHNESLHLCFSDFDAPFSGLPFHEVTLGVQGTDDMAAFGTFIVPHSSDVVLPGLELPCAKTIVATSTAYSAAMVMAVPLQAQIVVDCSAPVGGILGFTSMPDGDAPVKTRAFCWQPNEHAYGVFDAFTDAESSIVNYSFSLTRRDVPGALNAGQEVWHAAGLRQLVSLDSELPLLYAPASYQLTIRGCNAARLCSMVTSQFPLLVAIDPPTGGTVMVAADDISTAAYLNSPSQLFASWSGFEDMTLSPSITPADGLALTYLACIGSSPFGCQRHRFHAMGNSTYWHASGLSLRCGANHYVTVRASNCAGLQHTIASQPIKLCCQGPSSGRLTFMDASGARLDVLSAEGELQPQTATWSGFEEPCSGIKAYTVQLTNVSGGELLWEQSTSYTSVALPSTSLLQLTHGNKYELKLKATSHAGHHTSVSTSFTVDRTPPDIGNAQVREGTSGAAWYALDGYNASGRHSRGSLCLSAAAEWLEVQWSISDDDSQVKTREFALRDTQDDNATFAWQAISSAAPLRLSKATLSGGATSRQIILGARACNSIGLCSVSISDTKIQLEARPPSAGHARHVTTRGETDGFFSSGQIRIDFAGFIGAGCPAVCGNASYHHCYHDPTCTDSTPRLGGTGCNSFGAGQECRSCGFGDYEPCPWPVLSASDGLNVSNITGGNDNVINNAVEAAVSNSSSTEFSVEAAPMVPVERTLYLLPSPEESPLTYEACVGTTPFGCQLQNFAATQSNESWTSADGLQLRCSANHYVTIRATNCAGLQRTVASSASKLCCEPPVRGSATLHDASGLQLAYIGRSSASHANLSWSGFSDPCSGIREYTVALRAASAGGTDPSLIPSPSPSPSPIDDEYVQPSPSPLPSPSPMQSSSPTIWNVSGLPASASEWLLPSEVLDGLTDGSSYDVVVTATSHAGLQSEVVASFTIDHTRPVASILQLRWPGMSAGGLIQQSTHSVSCVPAGVPSVDFTWAPWKDNSSHIASYSFGYYAYDQNRVVQSVTDWHNVGPVGFSSIPTNALFSASAVMALGVRACDAVSLCSDSELHFAVLVDQPPLQGHAEILPTAGASPGSLIAGYCSHLRPACTYLRSASAECVL